jgi:hypothetical protein
MASFSVALCVAAFVISLLAGRRSLASGFIAVLAVGYLYGIVRANLEERAAHFIFDAATAGFYIAIFNHRLTPAQKFLVRGSLAWLIILSAWPLLMFALPMQDPLIQLVGLRGAIFFLPYLVLGALFTSEEVDRVSSALIILNAVALAFAVLEMKLGMERFYPDNAVDVILYRSHDVIVNGYREFRIPSTFAASADYAGSMTAGLPFLLDSLTRARTNYRRYTLLAGVSFAAIGVFIAASRTWAVVLIAVVAWAAWSGRLRAIPRNTWIIAVGLTIIAVAFSPRMQRFLILRDTSYDVSRIHGSVNFELFKLAAEYPLGNGLGGGGTSIPYFLQPLLKNPVGFESEYGRILLEQGIPGLMLWFIFIVWVATRPPPSRDDRCYLGRSLGRMFSLSVFATAMTGTGALTAIPQTAIFLVLTGWVTAPAPMPVRKEARRPASAAIGASSVAVRS